MTASTTISTFTLAAGATSGVFASLGVSVASSSVTVVVPNDGTVVQVQASGGTGTTFPASESPSSVASEIYLKNNGNSTATILAKIVPLASSGSVTIPLTSFGIPGGLVTTTGTMRFYVDGSYTIVSVRASVGTAPTGSSVICDVLKNGTTIFTTTGNRPTISASAFTGLSGTPDVATLATADYLTVNVSQVGSTIAGSDLCVTVTVTKSGN